jgi:DNA-binding transcriptional ArsR family regulator
VTREDTTQVGEPAGHGNHRQRGDREDPRVAQRDEGADNAVDRGHHKDGLGQRRDQPPGGGDQPGWQRGQVDLLQGASLNLGEQPPEQFDGLEVEHQRGHERQQEQGGPAAESQQFPQSALGAEALRARGDPARLRLLEFLLHDEHTVSECVRRVGLSQGRVSAHLGCMAGCGYVQGRRAGRFAYYTVADPRVADLVMLARALAADNAAALAECVPIAPDPAGQPAALL